MEDMILGIAVILFGILLASIGSIAWLGMIVGAFGLVIVITAYHNQKKGS